MENVPRLPANFLRRSFDCLKYPALIILNASSAALALLHQPPLNPARWAWVFVPFSLVVSFLFRNLFSSLA